MEHRLWQYTSQKNTDCKAKLSLLTDILAFTANSLKSGNSIARQLQVPTQILIRHAAFLYETQLRGIQQQLRMGEMGKTKASDSASASGRSSRASRPSSAMHGEFPFASGYDFLKSVLPGLSYRTAHSEVGNRPGSTTNAASPMIDNASGNIPGSSLLPSRG